MGSRLRSVQQGRNRNLKNFALVYRKLRYGRAKKLIVVAVLQGYYKPCTVILNAIVLGTLIVPYNLVSLRYNHGHRVLICSQLWQDIYNPLYRSVYICRRKSEYRSSRAVRPDLALCVDPLSLFFVAECVASLLRVHVLCDS